MKLLSLYWYKTISQNILSGKKCRKCVESVSICEEGKKEMRVREREEGGRLTMHINVGTHRVP